MKLNTEAIRRLADRIELCDEVELAAHHPEMRPSFTMNYDLYGCGAPACIIGHCHAMHGRTGRLEKRNSLMLADDLGITDAQVNELCMPQHEHANFSRHAGQSGHITKAHAVKVLRNLARTGNVYWRITG